MTDDYYTSAIERDKLKSKHDLLMALAAGGGLFLAFCVMVGALLYGAVHSDNTARDIVRIKAEACSVAEEPTECIISFNGRN
jgi:hypothetical protein